MPTKSSALKIDGTSYDISVLTESLGFLTRVTHMQEREYMRGSEQTGISPGLYTALALIDRNPGIWQGLLATLLFVQESNMTALVRSMVDKGLVERGRDTKNHRAACLTLTRKGQDLVKNTQATMQKLDRSFADVLSDRELARVLKALEVLFRYRLEHGSAAHSKRSKRA